MKHTIRFCPFCGSQDLAFTTPAGDNRRRHHCLACGHIQYFNPIPVVGAVLEWQGKILMCQRAIEPRLGLWTYPAGFMELGETVEAGAARECLEEAGAACEEMALFAMIALYREGQIHITYRGQLRDGRAQPGEESSKTVLLEPEKIDALPLAFPVVAETLRLYREDLARKRFGLHQGYIDLHPDGSYDCQCQRHEEGDDG